MPRSGIIWTRSRELKFERQVPPDAQDDDFLVEMSTPEEILCRGRFRHPSRYRREPSLSSLHQNLAGLVRMTEKLGILSPKD
jgi:hypothetical protein